MIKCKTCNNSIICRKGKWDHFPHKLRHPVVVPELQKEEVIAEFVKFEHDFNCNSDCGGFAMKWKCPSCEDELIWAPYHWWPLECHCRKWEFEIKATGTLDLTMEDENDD